MNRFNKWKWTAKKSFFITKFEQYRQDSEKTWGLINKAIGKTHNKQDIPNAMSGDKKELYSIVNISNNSVLFPDVGQ